MSENKRDELIEYAKNHFSELIPYDDPDYYEKLQKLAEDYADFEMNGNEVFKEQRNHHDETPE